MDSFLIRLSRRARLEGSRRSGLWTRFEDAREDQRDVQRRLRAQSQLTLREPFASSPSRDPKPAGILSWLIRTPRKKPRVSH